MREIQVILSTQANWRSYMHKIQLLTMSALLHKPKP